jgi:hypothetical protein
MKPNESNSCHGTRELSAHAPSSMRPLKSRKIQRPKMRRSIVGAAVLAICSTAAAACSIEPSFGALSSKDAAAKLHSEFQLQCNLGTGMMLCSNDERATNVSLDFSKGHLSQLLIIGPLKPVSNTHSVFAIAKTLFTVPADTKSAENERLRTDFFDPEHRENIISTPNCTLSRRHRNNFVIFIFVAIPKN